MTNNHSVGQQQPYSSDAITPITPDQPITFRGAIAIASILTVQRSQGRTLSEVEQAVVLFYQERKRARMRLAWSIRAEKRLKTLRAWLERLGKPVQAYDPEAGYLEQYLKLSRCLAEAPPWPTNEER